jgi:acetyltransferase-like isoleucine patch superfamily enzyme
MAYIILDTATNIQWHYKKAVSNAWVRIGGTSVSGTSGQVAYFDGTTSVTGDAGLIYSAANKTLGINTTTTSGANLIIKNSQEPARSTFLTQQTFGADTTNWTRGTGWTFNNTFAVATAATGNLTYTTLPDTIISGRAYEITYTQSGYSSGTATIALGNVTLAIPQYNVTSNIILLLPTSETGGFRITTSTYTGNLDNISIVEITGSAPIIFAGQDDGSATLYNSLRMPTTTTLAFGGGGARTTGVGNNVFIGPGVRIANDRMMDGNLKGTTIGDGTKIGMGTMIGAGLKIGKNVIIGQGSVVLYDIDDDEVFAGNPAKIIR